MKTSDLQQSQSAHTVIPSLFFLNSYAYIQFFGAHYLMDLPYVSNTAHVGHAASDTYCKCWIFVTPGRCFVSTPVKGRHHCNIFSFFLTLIKTGYPKVERKCVGWGNKTQYDILRFSRGIFAHVNTPPPPPGESAEGYLHSVPTERPQVHG